MKTPATVRNRPSVEARILFLRRVKVVLDADLAELYGVKTSRLNEAVKRNRARFPADFMFRVSAAEVQSLRSQIAISNSKRGGRRTRPWAFTEHGAIMIASVLNSVTAIEASVFVVRAFIKLREFAGTRAHLASQLKELERRVTTHDADLQQVITALRGLLATPVKPRRAIGFSKSVSG